MQRQASRNRIAMLARATTLFAALASTSAFADDLTVALHGIRVQTGKVRIALVDSQVAWDGKAQPVKGEAVAPTGETMTFSFKNLKPGTYAVMVTHDENGNGKLDTNLIGMPIEGFGFSNNPQVMRKPTWEEARFDLGETAAAIDINLH
ncbi:MAG: DUF2141 domain-containing protein [Pseudomonas fluorescens]